MRHEDIEFIADYMIEGDMGFLRTVSNEVYNIPYVGISYNVTDTGIYYDDVVFYNDFEDELAPCTAFFSLEEIEDAANDISTLISDKLSKGDVS